VTSGDETWQMDSLLLYFYFNYNNIISLIFQMAAAVVPTYFKTPGNNGNLL
jgi:hypothetical protein